MDSSRSGLLSTLLMTLPLIVVPAIALLRPPGPISGVSTAALDASEDDDFGIPGFDELTGTTPSDEKKPKRSKSSDDDFSEIFPDEAGDSDRSGKKGEESDEALDDAPLFDEVDAPKSRSSKTAERGASRKGSSKKKPETEEADETEKPADSVRQKAPGDIDAPDDASDPSSQEIIKQLNAMGAIRTLWFHAGESTPVGLAVFFRGDTELMRYRFEAVGASRDECARNVLDQVLAWQKSRLQAE